MQGKQISFVLSVVLIAPIAHAAPSMSVDLVRGPDDAGPGIPVVLDANGDFQWLVQVTPDEAAALAGNGIIEAELAFVIQTGVGTQLVGATAINPSDWDHNRSSAVPTGFGSGFSWLALNGNNEAEGLQFNTAADEVFAGLGSVNFASATPSNFVLITATGPSVVGDDDTPVSYPLLRRTSALQWGGAYSGAGLLDQDPLADTLVSGSQSFSAIVGDANLNGEVDLADFNTIINNFGAVTDSWNVGNFNNRKSPQNNPFTLTVQQVDLYDFHFVINFFGMTSPVFGFGGISTVPEPASAIVMATGVFLAIGAWRRRYRLSVPSQTQNKDSIQ